MAKNKKNQLNLNHFLPISGHKYLYENVLNGKNWDDLFKDEKIGKLFGKVYRNSVEYTNFLNTLTEDMLQLESKDNHNFICLTYTEDNQESLDKYNQKIAFIKSHIVNYNMIRNCEYAFIDGEENKKEEPKKVEKKKEEPVKVEEPIVEEPIVEEPTVENDILIEEPVKAQQTKKKSKKNKTNIE